MAVHAGPKVANDGLVFYYDMYNTDKSWKGAPTVNLHSSSDFTTGWSFTNSTIANGNELNETATTAGHFMLHNVSVTDTLVYTQTVEAKAKERSYLQIAPSTGFTQGRTINFDLINGTMGGTDPQYGTMIDLGGGWWRCSYSATCISTTTGRIVIAIADSFTETRLESRLGVANNGIYVRNPQMEQSDFPTPYTSGTRSNTQAVLDLSKNNYVATASSLTYAADDTFSFASGSADYINIPHASSPVTNLTYEVVINPTTLPAVETYMSVWQKSINWNGTTGISMQFIYGNFGFSFGDSWGGSVSHPQSNFTTGNYYHIVGTVTGNGGTATLYINGIQVDTGVAGTPTDTSDLTVGKGNGGSFNGSMPVFRMYDRCLDSTEVRQNFNAHRGRFGI